MGGTITFTRALYVPNAKASLITLGQLEDLGYKFQTANGVGTLQDNAGCLLHTTHWNTGNMTVLDDWDFAPGHPVVIFQLSNNGVELCHRSDFC
jgi:hypothetical protein